MVITQFHIEKYQKQTTINCQPEIIRLYLSIFQF